MHSDDFSSQVDEIIKGSYDLNVRAGPDASDKARLDALDTARWAHEAEMAGFALRSDSYPTAPLAYALNRIYPGLQVAGAIVLNPEVGGLNPHAVQAAADLGARLVWMPTRTTGSPTTSPAQSPGRLLTDSRDVLKSEVYDILDIIKRHEMALASGYISTSETLVLFREAEARGIRRMVASSRVDEATIEEQREIMDLGVFVEHAFLRCMPSFHLTTPEDIAAGVRALGMESCIVTTGFGHPTCPPPAEGMRMAIASLLKAGLSPEELSTLVKKNPQHLVGTGC